jgi:DNA-binding CsgD family transcriptional regulator
MKTQFEALSDRERQVIGLAALGYADKQISEELGVSVHTLRTYWDRIRNKLGGLSRPALVAAYVSEQVAGGEIGLFEELGLHGWVMDAKTWLVRATEETNEYHGLRPGIPHHAKEYTRLIHPQDLPEFLEQLGRVRNGETRAVNAVYRNVVLGGTETVHTTLIGQRGKDGAVEKVYGMRIAHAECRPIAAPKVQFGRFSRSADGEAYEIDEGLASIIGQEETRTISEAELFACVPGALERPGQEVRFRNFDGRLQTARLWLYEAPGENGLPHVFGFVAVHD